MQIDLEVKRWWAGVGEEEILVLTEDNALHKFSLDRGESEQLVKQEDLVDCIPGDPTFLICSHRVMRLGLIKLECILQSNLKIVECLKVGNYLCILRE